MNVVPEVGVHLLVSSFGGEVVGDRRDVRVYSGGSRVASEAAAQVRYDAAIEDILPGSGHHDGRGLAW